MATRQNRKLSDNYAEGFLEKDVLLRAFCSREARLERISTSSVRVMVISSWVRDRSLLEMALPHIPRLLLLDGACPGISKIASSLPRSAWFELARSKSSHCLNS